MRMTTIRSGLLMVILAILHAPGASAQALPAVAAAPATRCAASPLTKP